MNEKILFACVGNSCRSQIAEAWARKLADFPIEISSAGTKPASKVSSKAIEVMKEAGIDISDKKPKLLTPNMVDKNTHFISMGCGVEESCSVPLFKKNIEDWGLEDPIGKDLEFFRETRDIIKVKVQDLLKRIKNN